MSIDQKFDEFSEAVSHFETAYAGLSPSFARNKSAAARKHLMTVSKMCVVLRKMILEESKNKIKNTKKPGAKKKEVKKKVEKELKEVLARDEIIRNPDDLDDFDARGKGDEEDDSEDESDSEPEADTRPKKKTSKHKLIPYNISDV